MTESAANAPDGTRVWGEGVPRVPGPNDAAHTTPVQAGTASPAATNNGLAAAAKALGVIAIAFITNVIQRLLGLSVDHGYHLQHNESFVHKYDGVRHGGFWAPHTDELTLTSQNLVLTKKGLWGGQKGIQVYPLNQIKVFQGRAQAVVGEQRNTPALDVYFQSGTETFGFQSKKEAAFLAQKINQVITGTPPSMTSPNATGTEQVAEAIKDTVDAFKGAFGFASKAEAVARAAAVPAAKDCGACGAPVSGIQGQVTTCSYCDTANQL